MSIANFRRVLLLLGFAIGGYSILLGRHYTTTRPAQPDPEIGATNYYKGVDGIAYLTNTESWLVNGSFWLALAIIAGNVFLAFRYPDRRQ